MTGATQYLHLVWNSSRDDYFHIWSGISGFHLAVTGATYFYILSALMVIFLSR
jgi:hypothetical protein